MSKIKLDTPQKEVSSEEIKNRRNFDQLLKDYNAAPKPAFNTFYKSPYFASAIIGTALVATIALFYVSNKKEESTTNTTDTLKVSSPIEKTKQAAFIQPAFKDIQISYEKLSVTAEKGGFFQMKSGSVVKVPANAFKDAAGNSISGKVDLQYREFRDAVDMLVSGIPMKYDSAGIEMQLESGGMFELNGSHNGKTISLQKNITVEFASKNMPGDFNQYYLDTVARQWKYLGKDKLVKEKASVVVDTFRSEVVSESFTKAGKNKKKGDNFIKEILTEEIADGSFNPYEQKLQTLKDSVSALQQKAPVKPIKAKVQNYSFDLDVLPNDFPELMDYKGLRFEVGPENKTFSPKLYSIVWDDVRLDYNTPGKNYKITFIKDSKPSTFIVYPIYEGKDSAKVMALFHEKYKVYEKKLNVRLEEERKMKEARDTELKKQEEERQKRAELQKKADEEFMATTTAINDGNVRRMFSVSQFGVYNCDFASFYPKRIVLTAAFTSEGNDLNPKVVYMMDAEKNTLFQHYSDYRQFFYNPDSKHTLFSILPNNQLAVFDSEDFKNVKKENGKSIFDMKKTDKSFSNIKELKEYLLSKK